MRVDDTHAMTDFEIEEHYSLSEALAQDDEYTVSDARRFILSFLLDHMEDTGAPVHLAIADAVADENCAKSQYDVAPALIGTYAPALLRGEDPDFRFPPVDYRLTFFAPNLTQWMVGKYQLLVLVKYGTRAEPMTKLIWQRLTTKNETTQELCGLPLWSMHLRTDPVTDRVPDAHEWTLFYALMPHEPIFSELTGQFLYHLKNLDARIIGIPAEEYATWRTEGESADDQALREQPIIVDSGQIDDDYFVDSVNLWTSYANAVQDASLKSDLIIHIGVCPLHGLADMLIREVGS